MKCPKCGDTLLIIPKATRPPTVEYKCYRCDAEQAKIETVRTEYKPFDSDDDLRDEVAKAAMQAWLITLSARYGKAFEKDEDIADEAAYMAFISTESFMTERARRREGR